MDFAKTLSRYILDKSLDRQLFSNLFKSMIWIAQGALCEFIVSNLRDVVALVWDVSTSNFDLHLEGQRLLINLLTFDHPNFVFNNSNYAMSFSYQHVFLGELKQKNSLTENDLKISGLGGSLSGSTVSSIYSDIITEVFNDQIKR